MAQGSTAPQPPVPAGTGSPARAPSLPPELSRAPAGTTVEGQVQSSAADGRVTVRTAQGEVQLQLSRTQVAQLLRPGTPVTVEIRNPAVQPPQVQLTVRAAPSAGSGAAPPQPAVTTGSAAPAPTVPLTVGRIIQATVVPGPSAAGAAQAPGQPTGQVPSQAQPQAQASAQPPAQAPAQTPAQTPPAQPAAAPGARGAATPSQTPTPPPGATAQPGPPGVPSGPAGQPGAASPAGTGTGAPSAQPATVPAAAGGAPQAAAAQRAVPQGAASPPPPGQGAPQGTGQAPGSPAGATPPSATPGQGAPGQAVPGQASPGQASPGQTVPSQTVPGQAIPGQAVPNQAVPNQAAPAAAAPGQATPPPASATQASATQATAASQASTSQASANQTGQAQASTSGSPPAAAATAAAGRAALPNGAVLTVRVAAVAEAAARPEGAPRAVTGLVQQAGQQAAPTRIDGQIAGLTAAGRPVVQSPVGFLALDARADLRLGTSIALDVLASRSSGTAERAAPLPVLAREWPALESALRVLEEQLGPNAARQVVEGMPRPGPQLTATMLFFMTALRGGDLRGWLGRNAVQTLEQAGRGELLRALGDDFQTLQRATEPSETGWRSFLIPVAWDERRPIRLLTRNERREGREGRSGKPGTAFLVDLDLTNIGPFRLDGLVREQLLDLLIRTTKPLPAVMRQDIKALFDGTLDRTGIVGRLTFKASPVMPPLPVDLDAGSSGGTTTLTV